MNKIKKYDCISLEEGLQNGDFVAISIPENIGDYLLKVLRLNIDVRRFYKKYKKELGAFDNTARALFAVQNSHYLKELGLLDDSDKHSLLRPMSATTFNKILSFEKIDEDYVNAIFNNPTFIKQSQELAFEEKYREIFVPNLKRMLQNTSHSKKHGIDYNNLFKVSIRDGRSACYALEEFGIPLDYSEIKLKKVLSGECLDVDLMKSVTKCDKYKSTPSSRYKASQTIVNRSSRIDTYKMLDKNVKSWKF